MTKKPLKSVLLVDDDEATNYLNARILKSYGIKDIIVKNNGAQALDYLKDNAINNLPQPDLVLLDLNMPLMNGWEFLEEYKTLKENHKASVVIIMLTTSLNPSDEAKAKSIKEVNGFWNKPLPKQGFGDIIENYFKSQEASN